MVSAQHNDHEPQADVVFVIEATSMNGTFINELKSNYILPILEYFNQGPIESNEISCDNRNILYTIILYHSADIRPKPCCRTFAQERDPQFILTTIDKVKLNGGKAQANANIAEGLATCLQFFDDIKPAREGCQKFCILICSSPPYAICVMENEKYAGNNLEQLAVQFCEKNIRVSVLSPRKIPALFKLYEKTGGDLTHTLSKNYSKNARHLVLLNGFSLKERPVSPSTVSPKSNPVNIGSPTPAVNVPFRQNTPQGPPGQVPAADVTQTQQSQQQQIQPQPQPLQQQHQQVQQPNQVAQQQLQHSNQNAQMMSPHSNQPNSTCTMPGMNANFTQKSMNFGRGTPQQRWPLPGNQPRPFQNTPQQPSALINQLKQPPNAMPPQFRFDGPQISHSVNMINQNQNQQMHQQFQNQLQQQQHLRMVDPNSMMGQHSPMMASQAMNSIQGTCERQTVWRGILEWNDKQSKNPNDVTRQVSCMVTSNAKDGEPEVKLDNWPPKLVMQLLPKQLISSIGGVYLKNSTSVLFHPTQCEALDALTKMMSSGFAGCVQFGSSTTSNCEIKVLILLYTTDKRAYLGFIPNDHMAFVERLRKLIQQRKNSTAVRQVQGNTTGSQTATNTGNVQGPAGHMTVAMMPNSNLNNPMNGQQSHMGGMMVGGMPHGSVNPAEAMMQAQNNQQTIIHQNSNVINIPQGPMGLRGNVGMLGPRPQLNDHSFEMAAARQQNLAKIHQLRQTLAAAQQQELQYQTQLEPPFGRHSMVNMPKQPQQQSQQSRIQAASQSNSQFEDGGFDFL